jgi:hypothetical protein
LDELLRDGERGVEDEVAADSPDDVPAAQKNRAATPSR